MNPRSRPGRFRCSIVLSPRPTPTRRSRKEDDNSARPTILVSLARGSDERLYEWIAVGAEEEGIPCRPLSADESDDAALAYAAQNSRLGVGISVASGRIAVHERHMPAARPVVATEVAGHAEQACRSAGSYAARLIIDVPLRLDEKP